MDSFLRRFRATAARTTGRSWAAPEERALRTRAIEHARTRRAEGASRAAIAAELGLSLATVRRYLAGHERGAVLREVTVTPATRATLTTTCLVLVTPGGYRVEGASLADLVVLLRSLA
jgi:hypothetical protein